MESERNGKYKTYSDSDSDKEHDELTVTVDSSTLSDIVPSGLCRFIGENLHKKIKFYHNRNPCSVAKINSVPSNPFSNVCQDIEELLKSDEEKLKQIEVLICCNLDYKSLPKDITKLKNLKILFLSECNIETLPKLPNGVDSFFSLSNKFKEFPEELLKLPLEYLNISNAKLNRDGHMYSSTMKALPDLSSFSKTLQELVLQNLKLTDEALPKIKRLEKLKIISLAGNKYMNIYDQTYFSNMEKLEVLDISETGVKYIKKDIPCKRVFAKNCNIKKIDKNIFDRCIIDNSLISPRLAQKVHEKGEFLEEYSFGDNLEIDSSEIRSPYSYGNSPFNTGKNKSDRGYSFWYNCEEGLRDEYTDVDSVTVAPEERNVEDLYYDITNNDGGDSLKQLTTYTTSSSCDNLNSRVKGNFRSGEFPLSGYGGCFHKNKSVLPKQGTETTSSDSSMEQKESRRKKTRQTRQTRQTRYARN